MPEVGKLEAMKRVATFSAVSAALALFTLASCEKDEPESQKVSVPDESAVRALNQTRKAIGRDYIDSIIESEAKARIADVDFWQPQGEYETSFDSPEFVEWYFSGTIAPKDEINAPYKIETILRQPLEFDPSGDLAEARQTLGLESPEGADPTESWEITAFVNLGRDALEQPLEIKGIKMGMTREEVAEKMGPPEGFTIAGVRSKYPKNPLTLKYGEDGKLDSLSFSFESGFETVFEALKEKYPSLETDGTTATIQDKEGSTLYLFIKFPTSTLMLSSKRAQDEMIRKAEERKKDI